MCKKLTIKEINDRFTKIHGIKYIYDWDTYKKVSQKMRMICPTHGEFLLSPDHHFRGVGCKKCGFFNVGKKLRKEWSIVLKEFNEIHNNKYEYDESTYSNTTNKMKIICKEHGEFWQAPVIHKQGHGCFKCACENRAKNRKISIDEMRQRFFDMHYNRYTYYWDTYINITTKMKMRCNKCGNIQERTLDSHFTLGAGCVCYTSKGEEKIINMLIKHNIEFETQKRFKNCKNLLPLPFDFYLTNLNCCVEYDGIQHFKPINQFGGINGFNILKSHDKIKTEYCKNNNIKLIRIPYWEFDNIERILITSLR